MDRKIRRRCKCGCGRRTSIGKLYLQGHNSGNKKHGMCGTGTYRIWKGMIQRCYGYGGVGVKGYKKISVCKRWRKSFQNFLKDMGPRPDGLTLDRIDNNGDYTPENCRWATWEQQAINRNSSGRFTNSPNRWITYNGKTMTRSEWAREIGISKFTLASRLRYGWPLKEVLFGKIYSHGSF